MNRYQNVVQALLGLGAGGGQQAPRATGTGLGPLGMLGQFLGQGMASGPQSFSSPSSYRSHVMPRGIAPMSTGDANVMDFGQAAQGMRQYNTMKSQQRGNMQGGHGAIAEALMGRKSSSPSNVSSGLHRLGLHRLGLNRGRHT